MWFLSCFCFSWTKDLSLSTVLPAIAYWAIWSRLILCHKTCFWTVFDLSFAHLLSCQRRFLFTRVSKHRASCWWTAFACCGGDFAFYFLKASSHHLSEHRLLRCLIGRSLSHQLQRLRRQFPTCASARLSRFAWTNDCTLSEHFSCETSAVAASYEVICC